MGDWILVPCLVTLRDEFNKIAPKRSKASDGSIGDSAHSKTISDHNPDETGAVPTRDADKINEVHGLDVDAKLNNSLITMEWCVQRILDECRKPGTSGKDRGRLKYIIYNKRIWESSNNWNQRLYKGKNPHDKHAHFSAEYDTEFEYDTSPWGLCDAWIKLLSFPTTPAPQEGPLMKQTEFNHLLANALYQVKIPDYAQIVKEGEERRSLTLAQYFGYSDGRADVARVEKKVDEVRARILTIENTVTQQVSLLNDIYRKLSPSQTRGAVNL